MRTPHEVLACGEPQAPAILAPGREPLTFSDLRESVDRLAGQLRSLGVTRGDRVAIVLPNGPEMAVAFLGVASCATAAPLNPRYHEDEFRFYLQDLGAKALITRAGDIQIMVHAAAEAANRSEVLSGGVSDRQETRGVYEVPQVLKDLIDSSLTAEERSRLGKPELVS